MEDAKRDLAAADARCWRYIRGRAGEVCRFAFVLLAAVGLASCDNGRPLGVTGIQVRPLPTTVQLYRAAIFDKFGHPIAPDPDSTRAPLLRLWPHGAVSLAGIQVQGVYPPPPSFGVHRPEAIYKASLNYLGETFQGMAAGDVLAGELSGVNWRVIDPFYGVSADTLDSMAVLGGWFTIVAVEDSVVTGAAWARVQVGAKIDTLSEPFTLVHEHFERLPQEVP